MQELNIESGHCETGLKSVTMILATGLSNRQSPLTEAVIRITYDHKLITNQGPDGSRRGASGEGLQGAGRARARWIWIR